MPEESWDPHDLMPTLEEQDDGEPVIRCSRCGLRADEVRDEPCEAEGM